jgi:hypothetical protein
MPNDYRDIDINKLIELAEDYVDECLSNQKEAPTAKGAVVFKERNLPTIKFFVMHWLKKQDFNFYTRQYFYDALKDENHPLSDTLKKIREYFDSVAEDIVANEGKGIFYAKNRLGMTDKVDSRTDNTNKITVEYVSATPGTSHESEENKAGG